MNTNQIAQIAQIRETAGLAAVNWIKDLEGAALAEPAQIIAWANDVVDVEFLVNDDEEFPMGADERDEYRAAFVAAAAREHVDMLTEAAEAE